MKDDIGNITHNRITLEKIQFGISQMVSSSFLEDMQFHSEYDVISDSFRKTLSFFIVGNKINQEEYDDVVNVYPTTMWEELKRDFWPRWLKKRFPVKYSRDILHRTVKHFHICPHLNIPDQRPHIDFMVMRNEPLKR